MKTLKILVASLFIVGATFGGYKAYKAYNQNDLLTQNLKALADGEVETQISKDLNITIEGFSLSVDGPIPVKKIRCKCKNGDTGRGCYPGKWYSFFRVTCYPIPGTYCYEADLECPK